MSPVPPPQPVPPPKPASPSPREILVTAVLEAALIAVVAIVGWLSHSPFVFASLGPTAFELVEFPERRSARPYNILFGNLIAIFVALFALWVTHAWSVPAVSASGVPPLRVASGVLAVGLTATGTLFAKATQPAALSTTLLISLGIMQTPREIALILAAVTLLTLIGEPLRRFRCHHHLA